MGVRIILAFVASTLLITLISAKFHEENVSKVTMIGEQLLCANTINGLHTSPSEAVLRRAAAQTGGDFQYYTSCSKYRVRYHGQSQVINSYNLFEVTTNPNDGTVFWLKRIGTDETDNDFVLIQETAF